MKDSLYIYIIMYMYIYIIMYIYIYRRRERVIPKKVPKSSLLC